MKSVRARSMLLLVMVLCVPVRAEEPRAVKIIFSVKVPEKTPENAKLYLCGDAKSLGSWIPPGIALKKQIDGTYVATVLLAKDRQAEFKVTRGSWETVEKNVDGSERDNRTLTPTREARVDVEVKAWADQFAPATAPATTTATTTPATTATTTATTRASTRSGDIRAHEKFHSKNLNNDRDVLVWLPPGYEKESDRRYPVLYMHDGQNVFDASTSFAGEWRADETAQRLIDEKKIEPIIVVAIANTRRRMDEYTLDHSPQYTAGGEGETYIKFLADEVKPFIDKTYRTKPDRENTAVGGSSLGGLISLEICRLRPDQFGKCAAISPAMQWAGGKAMDRLKKDSQWMKQCKIWVDTGTAEDIREDPSPYVENVRAIEKLLDQAGGAHRVLVIEGAKHNEAAWAARFDQVLMFLFPK